MGAKRLAALKGYVVDAWPLALVALVCVGYSASFCSYWSRTILSSGNVITSLPVASKDAAPPFNTNLLCCEHELDKCCVNIHDGNTDFTKPEKLFTTSDATKSKQSYTDKMPKYGIQSSVGWLRKAENQSYYDMAPKSYIDMMLKGGNQSYYDMIPKGEMQFYVDMMPLGWIQSYVDMLPSVEIKTCVDMLSTVAFRKQVLLLGYFVTTSLTFVIVLVVKRGRCAIKHAKLAVYTAVPRTDCATRMRSFEDMFNMRPKIFVHQVIRRNWQMKSEATKNRKKLKQFAVAVRQVTEKKKGLRVSLERNADLLLKMEEKEQELSAINVDLKIKLKDLEGKMVTVGLRPEQDDSRPRNPVHVTASDYIREGATVATNIIRRHNTKSTGSSPQRHVPNP